MNRMFIYFIIIIFATIILNTITYFIFHKDDSITGVILAVGAGLAFLIETK